MTEYVIFMPSTTSYYTELCRLGAKLTLTSSTRNLEIKKLRPMGASSLAWTTTDQHAMRRMKRLGALVVVKSVGGESPGREAGPR